MGFPLQGKCRWCSFTPAKTQQLIKPVFISLQNPLPTQNTWSLTAANYYHPPPPD